jgi:hypothetical protein
MRSLFKEHLMDPLLISCFEGGGKQTDSLFFNGTTVHFYLSIIKHQQTHHSAKAFLQIYKTF